MNLLSISPFASFFLLCYNAGHMKERKDGPSRVDGFMSDFLSKSNDNASKLAKDREESGQFGYFKTYLYNLDSFQFTQLWGKILSSLAQDQWNQDQRETALLALATYPKGWLSSYNASELAEQYLQVLGQQNEKHHPYEIVENLFDAGRILFPGLPLKKEDKQNMLLEMERVNAYFSNDKLTHEGLTEKITEFSETTTSVSPDTRAIRPSRPAPDFSPPPERIMQPPHQRTKFKPLRTI